MTGSNKVTELDGFFTKLFALTFASLVAGLVAGVGLLSGTVFTTIFVMAFGHALVLGLPVYFVFRRLGWTNTVGATLGGAIVGLIPASIYLWPRYMEIARIQILDGIPTGVAAPPFDTNWSGYIEALAIPATYGALAGFAFWITLRFLYYPRTPDHASEPGQKRAPWKDPLSITCGVALLVMAFIGTKITFDGSRTDTTCHNLLRDGRTSIGAQMSMGLPISIEDWPYLLKIFERFAANHALDLRQTASLYPKTVRTMELSLCSDTGLAIKAHDQRWASRNYEPLMGTRGMSIAIYETQDGSRWKELGTELIGELETRWPGQLKLNNSENRDIPRPELPPSTNQQ